RIDWLIEVGPQRGTVRAPEHAFGSEGNVVTEPAVLRQDRVRMRLTPKFARQRDARYGVRQHGSVGEIVRVDDRFGRGFVVVTAVLIDVEIDRHAGASGLAGVADSVVVEVVPNGALNVTRQGRGTEVVTIVGRSGQHGHTVCRFGAGYVLEGFLG